MPSENACNRWIFREGRISTRGHAVSEGLAASLARLSYPTRDGIVDALIRAGELETALADCGSDYSAIAAGITDAAAAAPVGMSGAESSSARLGDVVLPIQVSDRMDISIPEGFAYCALHPLVYAELVD